MKSVIRGALIGVPVIVASLFAVVLIRTVASRPVQLEVEPITRLEVDEGVDERLAGAIRLPTVSRAETPEADFAAFDALHRHLETGFPHVLGTLSREVVGGHSLFR